jgi:hypothetical protein
LGSEKKRKIEETFTFERGIDPLMSHMHDSPLKFSSFMMEREIKFTKSEMCMERIHFPFRSVYFK